MTIISSTQLKTCFSKTRLLSIVKVYGMFSKSLAKEKFEQRSTAQNSFEVFTHDSNKEG
jgi:hypothetical protein